MSRSPRDEVPYRLREDVLELIARIRPVTGEIEDPKPAVLDEEIVEVSRSVAVALEAPDHMLEDDHRPVTSHGLGGAAQHE